MIVEGHINHHHACVCCTLNVIAEGHIDQCHASVCCHLNVIAEGHINQCHACVCCSLGRFSPPSMSYCFLPPLTHHPFSPLDSFAFIFMSLAHTCFYVSLNIHGPRMREISNIFFLRWTWPTKCDYLQVHFSTNGMISFFFPLCIKTPFSVFIPVAGHLR